MKRVILYGLANIPLRRKMEHFLDDEYQIIGYADTYLTSDIVDQKTFFSLSQLGRIEFDYILLGGGQTSTWESMRRLLVDCEIPDERIISPIVLLQEEGNVCRPDLIASMRDVRQQNAEGLIFGLSYSLLGIDKEELSVSAYDFSYHGLDLYYNNQLYRYSLEHDLFQDASVALLEFPYYYFDYDMSSSLYQYEIGQIFTMKSLDDWHHYARVPNGNDYIVNYRMFGNKIMKYYRRPCFEIPNHAVYQEDDYSDTLGRPWFAEREATVEENKEIFCQLIQKLQERNMRICLITPPFYMRGIDQKSSDAVVKKKQRFYDILQELDMMDKLEIFDYTQLYADKREFFYDTTHLNYNGAKAFTKVINAEVLEKGK